MNRVLNPVTKPCLICKEIMENVRTDKKYCSSICARKATHYISFKNCLQCGAEMKNIHGHQKYCSTACYRVKQSYENKCNRLPEHKEKVNAQSRKQRNVLIQFLREYKLSKGCLDCGYNDHHVALQFDHVKEDKYKNVSYCKSIGMAKKEIEKCEVVCANCHHIRTFERKQTI